MLKITTFLLLLALVAPAYGQITLSFAEQGGGSAVQISAPNAQLVRQGDDVQLMLPIVHLRKNISGVGDVQFEHLQFFLHRRSADGSRQYLGKSDKDTNVKGVLTDAKGTASFQNARLRYQNAARECPDACVLSLTVWIKYGNTQSGGLSGPVEVQMKQVIK